jgi:hypothetical protein
VLQVSGLTHRESYSDMVMTVIVSVILSLVAILLLSSVFGSFGRQRSNLRASHLGDLPSSGNADFTRCRWNLRRFSTVDRHLL